MKNEKPITSQKKADDALVFPFQDTDKVFFEQKSDIELWKAFKKGHAGAFGYLYDMYFDVLYNYGCQFKLPATIIEDLLQDFFIELHRTKQALGEVQRIKPYLLKSFRRKVFRKMKTGKHFFYTEDAVDDFAFHIGFSNDIAFTNSQFNDVQRAYLDKAMMELTKRQREAVYYFYFEDLTYAEVAEVMGLHSAKGARNLIYQALNVLRKHPEKLPKWLLMLLVINRL